MSTNYPQQADFGKAGDRDLYVADLHVYRLMGWGSLGPYLHGIHRTDRWTEHYQAECLKWPREHEGVAHADCECGIYGWYKPDRDWDTGSGSTAFAVIRLSGRCVLGSLGVRAERAQILAVAHNVCPCGCSDDTPEQADFVAAMTACYPGVTVHASREALLREFPPSDWESIVGPIEEPDDNPFSGMTWSLAGLGHSYLAAYRQLMAQWTPQVVTFRTASNSAPTVFGFDGAQPAAPAPTNDPLKAFLVKAEGAPTDAVDAGAEPKIRVGLPSDLRITKATRSTGPQRDPFRRGGKG